MLRRVRPQSDRKAPDPAISSGKIMLGFAVVLAVSAASMGIAYLGFEHVSAGVRSLPQQRRRKPISPATSTAS